jgi:hypothetical protein
MAALVIFGRRPDRRKGLKEWVVTSDWNKIDGRYPGIQVPGSCL